MSTAKDIKKTLIKEKIDASTHNSIIESFFRKHLNFKQFVDNLISNNKCLMNRVQTVRWLLGSIKFRKCAVCKKRLDAKTSMRANAHFCSMACRKTPEGRKIWNDSKEKSLMEKYGVINVGQLSSTKEKAKQTYLERYGVDNPAKSKEIYDKIRQTNLARYGVDNTLMLPEVKEKIVKINKSKERNEKLHKTLVAKALKNREQELKKYNLEFVNPLEYEGIRQGSKWFETDLRCTDCGNIFRYKFHTNKVLSRACPHCYPFTQSLPEEEITNFIKKFMPNEPVLNNVRSLIHPKELDIYIPSKKLAIEFNGLYWHSESQGKDKRYHLDKTLACNEQGVRLVHIFEDEWRDKQQIVKNRLKHLLSLTPYKIFARKCEVRNVPNALATKFLNKYHIQGAVNASINLGLFYKNRLVALMTFCKSRFNKNYDYELLRFCTIGNFSIIGGAGKLFNYFKNNYEFESIVSYADRRWSNGGLYRALEFVELSASSPAYYYVKEDQRFNRVKFQKHKLANNLEIFDPGLSEFENMIMNGYARVWDCGNLCFGYHRTLI